MKKLMLLICASALCLSLCGCATIIREIGELTSDSYDDYYDGEYKVEYIDGEAEEEPLIIPPTISKTVLYDDNGVRITATDLTYDKYSGFDLDLLLENTGETTANIYIDSCSINGVMIRDSASIDIAAGKKTTEPLNFDTYEMESTGITDINFVDFLLTVRDDDYNELTENEPVKFQITDVTEPVAYEGNEIYNEGGISVKVLPMVMEKYGGADMPMIIENHTEHKLTIELRTVSINDFAMKPFFYCQVAPGKTAVDSLNIYDSELEDNNITEIDKVEFAMHFKSATTWEDLATTEPIVINVD